MIKISKEQFKIETDGDATVVSGNKEVYKSYALANELDMDTIKKVDKLNKDFVNDTAKALGDFALDHFKGNEKVNKITYESPFTSGGYSKLEGIVNRNEEIKNSFNNTTVNKSKIRIKTNIEYGKATKNVLREIEATLTEALIKG